MVRTFTAVVVAEDGQQLVCPLVDGVLQVQIFVLCVFFGFVDNSDLSLFNHRVELTRVSTKFHLPDGVYRRLPNTQDDQRFTLFGEQLKEPASGYGDVLLLPLHLQKLQTGPTGPTVVCDTDRVSYTGKFHELYSFLVLNKTPERFKGKARYNQRKAWRQNCKRRFRISEHGLLQRLPARTKKRFGRNTWLTVLELDQAVQILHDWHSENHDGGTALKIDSADSTPRRMFRLRWLQWLEPTVVREGVFSFNVQKRFQKLFARHDRCSL